MTTYTLTIEQDDYPHESPRDWDTFGTMVCFHKRYTLGDKHYYCHDNYDSWSEMEQAIIKEENVAVILPLYMYGHSGITINTTGFTCSWDSGQIGFIYVTKDDVRKEYECKKVTKKLKERVKDILLSEVKAYDCYLRGDCYGIEVKDDEDNVVDSIWGFIGDTLENSGMDFYINDYKDQYGSDLVLDIPSYML